MLADYLLYGVLAVGVVVLFLQFILLQRAGRFADLLEPRFRSLEDSLERGNR